MRIYEKIRSVNEIPGLRMNSVYSEIFKNILLKEFAGDSNLLNCKYFSINKTIQVLIEYNKQCEIINELDDSFDITVSKLNDCYIKCIGHYQYKYFVLYK